MSKLNNWEKRNTMDRLQWEELMGHVLTGLLREVDPAIDPNHLAHIPEIKNIQEEAQL